jgi:hypothetical protein
MRKNMCFIILLAFLVSLGACSGGDDQYQQSARAFVDLLANEQFEDAVDTFDQTMKSAFPSDKLEEVWTQILDKAGTFQKQLSTRQEEYLQYEIVFVTCQFENGKLDVKVVYNQSKQVAGLFFVPAQKQ